MSPSPYQRAPRLKVNTTGHKIGDVITVGSTRWVIRTLLDQNATLEALNANSGIIWHTTLNNLPDPIKETTP